MKIFGVLIFLLLASRLTQPQAAPPTQSAEEHVKALSDSIQGKIVHLKHSLIANDQKFDETGKPQGDAVGPWTIYGAMEPLSLKLKGNELVLEGHRLIVSYEANTPKYSRASDIVTAKIPLHPTPTAADVDDGVQKLLVGANESFANYVPEFWKRFLLGSVPPPHSTPPQPPASVDGRPTKVRISQIQLGAPEKAQKPIYPQLARAMRKSGSVIFVATIGKDGFIKAVSVFHPQGVGLDDAAYDAIKTWHYKPQVEVLRPLGLDLDESAIAALRTWKFEPATRDGQPVVAILAVDMSFELH
jgi:TonB family protein